MNSPLGKLVAIDRELFGPISPRYLISSLTVSRPSGRGNRARNRARSIVNGMVRSGHFGPDFDRLNRFGI